MRIVDFADGAQSETTPVIGNIKASALIEYPDDATYEATEQGAPQEGNIYFNTTDKSIRYYNGTIWQELIDEQSVQVVENKFIDADLNTITNIGNNEIKPLAGIEATKIADGSVDDTEFQYLDGVTSPIQTQLDAKQDLSEKGAANGYAPLDANQKVPLANIYTEALDNVDEFADFASFPVTGVTDRLYVAADTGAVYRWSGSMYVEVGSTVKQMNDLTDVDTSGIQDGQVLVYSSATSSFVPGTIQNVIQENIALIGKGTASWTVNSGNQSVSSNSTETNDFAVANNLKVGFTFTPSINNDLQAITMKLVDRGLANGDGSVVAYLYNTSSGLPTGSPIASTAGSPYATSNLTAVTNTVVTNNFTFSGTIPLLAGTKYAVLYESTDTGTIYLRRGNIDETFSENVEETGNDTETWQLSAVQETLTYDVIGTANSSDLVLDSDCYISIPGLPNTYHTIQAQTISIGPDQAAYVTINRSAGSVTNLSVVVDDITNITSDNDNIIIARNDNNECYFGLHDPQRFQDGDVFDIQKAGTGEISGLLLSKQIFETSGTWNKPAGCNKVIVEVIGGGGAGSGAAATGASETSGGSGGSAGGYCKKEIDVSAISSETVTIGAGGAGVSGTNGGSGGTSSFGAHCSASGGSGGTSTGPRTSGTGAKPSAPGEGTGGDINTSGQYGEHGVADGVFGFGGRGGNSFLGGGGVGGGWRFSSADDGNAGRAPGAGGGASANWRNRTARTGADGADGIVIVWEYS